MAAFYVSGFDASTALMGLIFPIICVAGSRIVSSDAHGLQERVGHTWWRRVRTADNQLA